MSIRRRLLSGDTDTPQGRLLKKYEETGGLNIWINDASGVQNAWDIELVVEQTGTAGYTADRVNVVETTVGSGDKKLIDRLVGGVSKFSVDNEGNVLANSLPVPVQSTGTFTPTIQDSSSSDAEGQTYSVQSGFYIKIGKLVHFNLRMVVTSIGTLSGSSGARIAGLPFPAVVETNNNASVSVGAMSNVGTGTGVVTGWVSGSQIRLKEWNSATDVSTTSDFTVTEYGGTGEIIVSGSYWTD